MVIKTVQNIASDPLYSVYVSASAGSGKTKILIDRYLRLLLLNIAPHKILCLTFTNAAADEMSHRILKRLKAWATISDELLCEEYMELAGVPPLAKNLSHMRSMYIMFLDNLSQIKIYTVHSLCHTMLQRYYSYNTKSFDYELMSTLDRSKLLFDSIQRVLLSGGREAFCTLSEILTDHQIRSLVQHLYRRKVELYAYAGSNEDISYAIHDALGLAPGLSKAALSKAALYQEILFPGDEVLAILKKISAVTLQLLQAARASSANIASDGASSDDGSLEVDLLHDKVDVYKDFWLTKDGKIRAAIIKMEKKHELPPNYQAIVEGEVHRILSLLDTVKKLDNARYFEALISFGQAVIKELDKQKDIVGKIEYDDIILKAIGILKASEDIAAMFYALDMGIEHVMVDEAQDLSIWQWEVINLISEQLFEDDCQHKNIFIVGDYKQSIYGFQGAAPDIFLSIRGYYKAKVEVVGRIWKDIDMNTSFRSNATILNSVDSVFEDRFSEITEYKHHHSFHGGAGVVASLGVYGDLEQGDYTIKGYKRTASAITRVIQNWLSTGRRLKGEEIKPDDIMLLVRKRGYFVDELVRQMKLHNIPVSCIGDNKHDSLVVDDLLTVAYFKLFPYDDYNLAKLLRSPICNVSEEGLFTLAYEREKKLLDRVAEEDPELMSFLLALNTDDGIAGLYRRVLYDSRRIDSFLERFGNVTDIIDAFYAAAIHYDMTLGKGLSYFTRWIKTYLSELSIPDDSLGCVRVITSHSAKGLQSPVVILADAANSEQTIKEEPILKQDGKLYFNLNVRVRPVAVQSAYDNHLKILRQENERLLYVAMTRAKEELYITGWENNKIEDSWYSMISKACEVREYSLEKQGVGTVKIEQEDASRQEVPDFVSFRKERIEYNQPIAISNLGMPEESLEQKIGVCMHKLLYILPNLHVNSWEERGYEVFQGLIEYGLSKQEVAKSIEQVVKSIKAFPEIFEKEGEGAKAEVPVNVISVDGDGKQVVRMGRIDRILIQEKLVKVIDFKSDANPPADASRVKAEYISQVSDYARSMKGQFPQHTIEKYILWVRTQELMMLK